MIKFSKDSWHYRFNRFVGRNWELGACPLHTTNLCSYFWGTVYNLFIFLATCVVGYVGASFIGGLVLSAFIGQNIGLTSLWYAWIVGCLILVLAGGGVVLLVVGVDFVKSSSQKLYYKTPTIQPSKKGQQRISLFTEWYKAKKDKVCPIIKFEG